MQGSLTFLKCFQFAKCYIRDRRQSLFIFKVLSLRLNNKDSLSKAGTAPGFNKVTTLLLLLPDGEAWAHDTYSLGMCKRVQVTERIPPLCKPLLQLSSRLQQSHLFGAVQSFRGHFSAAHLWMTLQNQETLEKMQVEIGPGWSCVADGSFGRQELGCAVWLATLDNKKVLRRRRNSRSFLIAIVIQPDTFLCQSFP